MYGSCSSTWLAISSATRIAKLGMTQHQPPPGSQQRGRITDLVPGVDFEFKKEVALPRKPGSAAETEEALVGLPGGQCLRFRSSIDKTIEYYEKAAAIFPTRSSISDKTWAEKIKRTRRTLFRPERDL